MLRNTHHRVLLGLFATGLFLLFGSSLFPSNQDPQPVPGSESRLEKPLSGTFQRPDRLASLSTRGVVVRPVARLPVETTRAGAAEPAERIVFLREGMDADAMAARLGAEVAGRIEAARAYRLRFHVRSGTRPVFFSRHLPVGRLYQRRDRGAGG